MLMTLAPILLLFRLDGFFDFFWSDVSLRVLFLLDVCDFWFSLLLLSLFLWYFLLEDLSGEDMTFLHKKFCLNFERKTWLSGDYFDYIKKSEPEPCLLQI